MPDLPSLVASQYYSLTLSLYLSLPLSRCLCLCRSVCLPRSRYLRLCRSVYLSLSRSIYLSLVVCLCMYGMSLYLHVSSVFLSSPLSYTHTFPLPLFHPPPPTYTQHAHYNHSERNPRPKVSPACRPLPLRDSPLATFSPTLYPSSSSTLPYMYHRFSPGKDEEFAESLLSTHIAF